MATGDRSFSYSLKKALSHPVRKHRTWHGTTTPTRLVALHRPPMDEGQPLEWTVAVWDKDLTFGWLSLPFKLGDFDAFIQTRFEAWAIPPPLPSKMPLLFPT